MYYVFCRLLKGFDALGEGSRKGRKGILNAAHGGSLNAEVVQVLEANEAEDGTERLSVKVVAVDAAGGHDQPDGDVGQKTLGAVGAVTERDARAGNKVKVGLEGGRDPKVVAGEANDD